MPVTSVATEKTSLARHNRSKHEGINYDCDQCDYQTTQKSNFTRHKRSKHGGMRYDCNKSYY